MGRLSKTAKKAKRDNSPAVDLGDKLDPNSVCGGCNLKINDEEAGMNVDCDHCHVWHHLQCAKLDKKVFDLMFNAKSYPGLSIKWFCPKCPTDVTPVPEIDKHIAAQDAKIDKLSTMFEQMQTNLNAVLTKLEPQKIEKNIGQHVSEVIQDNREIDEKKNNMMMFGLAEATDENKELENVKKVLTFVNAEIDTDQITTKSIVRLGQKKPRDDQRPRPLKIVFDDADTKWKYIKHAKKLGNSESFKKVGLSLDKTNSERLKDEKLRADLAAERKKRPTDDMIIFRGHIIPRATKAEFAMSLKTVSAAAGDGSQQAD